MPSQLLLQRCGGQHLLSSNGVRQGDPLSAILFCLYIRDVLTTVGVQAEVEVQGFFDDINVSGEPAEVMKVVLDEDSTRIEVVVPDDQLSLAIGRRGQNVRLASQLTGWDIDILTEAEESERRQKEFVERTNTFMTALDVDETVAQLLASEGFRSVEEIAYVDIDDLAAIEGFDAETAGEIQSRAQGHLAGIEAQYDDARKALGVSDELKTIEGLTTPMLIKLGENEVRTVEDLAGCATDDLVGWTER